MDLKNFSDGQRQALLDLAVLAMYSDQHLAAAEQERVERLLASMGVASDYDRAAQFDASVARVSRHNRTAESTRAHIRTLAGSFTSAEQRRMVHTILHDLIGADSSVSPPESAFLMALRESLELKE